MNTGGDLYRKSSGKQAPVGACIRSGADVSLSSRSHSRFRFRRNCKAEESR